LHIDYQGLQLLRILCGKTSSYIYLKKGLMTFIEEKMSTRCAVLLTICGPLLSVAASWKLLCLIFSKWKWKENTGRINVTSKTTKLWIMQEIPHTKHTAIHTASWQKDSKRVGIEKYKSRHTKTHYIKKLGEINQEKKSLKKPLYGFNH